MSTDTKALAERLRAYVETEHYMAAEGLCAEAADELERLTTQNETGWAEVERLARERDRLTTELANERANGVHTCNPGCDRSGCVNRRLRGELAALRERLEAAEKDAERLAFSYFGEPKNDSLIELQMRFLTGCAKPTMDEVRAAIDAAMSASTKEPKL